MDAKLQIIEVAERLFADSGINGASMREIAAKAGQGNHFAVQYHFKSRDGLVQAIFDHRMEQMEPTRGQMLQAAESEGRLGTVEALLEIVYLPQLELQQDDGRHAYAAFLAQYLLRHRPSRFGEFSPDTPPNLMRTLSMLRASIGELPEMVAQRRLISSSLMFVNILIHHRDAAWTQASGEPFSVAVADTLDQIRRCLTAPAP